MWSLRYDSYVHGTMSVFGCSVQVKDVFSEIAPAMGLSVGLAVGQFSIANEISELIDKPKLEFGVSFD